MRYPKQLAIVLILATAALSQMAAMPTENLIQDSTGPQPQNNQLGGVQMKGPQDWQNSNQKPFMKKDGPNNDQWNQKREWMMQHHNEWKNKHWKNDKWQKKGAWSKEDIMKKKQDWMNRKGQWKNKHGWSKEDIMKKKQDWMQKKGQWKNKHGWSKEDIMKKKQEWMQKHKGHWKNKHGWSKEDIMKKKQEWMQKHKGHWKDKAAWKKKFGKEGDFHKGPKEGDWKWTNKKGNFTKGGWGKKKGQGKGGYWFQKHWGQKPGPHQKVHVKGGNFGQAYGKGHGGNWMMKKWGRGHHGGGFLTKKYWWSGCKNKHTPKGKFRGNKHRIMKRLKHAWQKCMQKHRNKKWICKHKIMMKKKMMWNKFHKTHWRENMMRWNRMKDMNRKKFMMAKESFEHPSDMKPMEDLKNRLATLKKNLQKTKEEKLEMINLKKAYIKSKKTAFMAKDFEMYKKQSDSWYNTPVGSCVALYAKDYLNNLSKFWGTSEEERNKNRDAIKAKIEVACKNVEESMPFTNNGCMMQLNNQYHQLIAVFKDFIHNKSEENIKKMTDGVVNGFKIIKEQCFEKAEKKHKNCADYMKKELDVADVSNDDNNKKSWVKAIQVGFRWNKLGKSIEKLSDESFWLNSPDECDVVKQADEVIKATS